MSKKKWLLTILILTGLGYLLISKVNPDIGTAVDNAVGPTIVGFLAGVKTAVETSPTWQAYDIYFSMAFGAVIVGLLFWQGHNAYNKVRGVAVRSAQKEASGGLVFQTVPTAQPVTIPQATTPTVQPQQVIPPPVTEEKPNQ